MEQGRFYVVRPTMIDINDPSSGAEWDLRAFTDELTEFREDDKHRHDDMIDTLSTFFEVAPKRNHQETVMPVSVLR